MDVWVKERERGVLWWVRFCFVLRYFGINDCVLLFVNDLQKRSHDRNGDGVVLYSLDIEIIGG